MVDRLGKWFVEASEKVKKLQLMYMKRSFHSVNGVVKLGHGWHTWTNWVLGKGISLNLFAW